MKVVDLNALKINPRSFVLVDTSILMLIGERPNLLEWLSARGLKCVVTTTVLRELEKLARKAGKKGMNAKLALKVVETQCYLLEVEGKKWADDELVELALKYSVPVATADMGLRRRLLRKVPTFYYRESQNKIVSDDYYEI